MLCAVLVVVDMARKQNKTAREYSVSNAGEVSHLTPLLQENTDAVPPKAAFGPRIRWREKKYFGGRRFEVHRQRMKQSRRGGEFLCNDEQTSVKVNRDNRKRATKKDKAGLKPERDDEHSSVAVVVDAEGRGEHGLQFRGVLKGKNVDEKAAHAPGFTTEKQ